MNQVNIGQRIKKKREQQKLSLQAVADKLDVNRSSVMRWENGETGRIKLPMLERLAQILQTTPEYLMGYEEDDLSDSASRNAPPESVCMIPVLEKLQITNGALSWQNVSGYEVSIAEFRQNCFFLQITENSMAPRLEEGDRILVHRQNSLANGDTGVFLIDDKECMVRLYNKKKQIELHAFNPYFPTLQFDLSEAKRIKVIGKVMESRRKW